VILATLFAILATIYLDAMIWTKLNPGVPVIGASRSLKVLHTRRAINHRCKWCFHLARSDYVATSARQIEVLIVISYTGGIVVH
jgi:hypothetical protein